MNLTHNLAAALVMTAASGCLSLTGLTGGEADAGVDAGAEAGAHVDAKPSGGGGVDAGGGCVIQGTVYAPSEPNPDNACQLCDPSANAAWWSSAPTSTKCDSLWNCDGQGNCALPGAG